MPVHEPPQDIPPILLLPEEESELLQAIHEVVPLTLLKERNELAHSQQERAWTPQERERFLELTNQIETCEAKRISLLAKLAQKRSIPLAELARQLNFSSL